MVQQCEAPMQEMQKLIAMLEARELAQKYLAQQLEMARTKAQTAQAQMNSPL